MSWLVAGGYRDGGGGGGGVGGGRLRRVRRGGRQRRRGGGRRRARRRREEREDSWPAGQRGLRSRQRCARCARAYLERRRHRLRSETSHTKAPRARRACASGQERIGLGSQRANNSALHKTQAGRRGGMARYLNGVGLSPPTPPLVPCACLALRARACSSSPPSGASPAGLSLRTPSAPSTSTPLLGGLGLFTFPLVTFSNARRGAAAEHMHDKATAVHAAASAILPRGPSIVVEVPRSGRSGPASLISKNRENRTHFPRPISSSQLVPACKMVPFHWCRTQTRT